MPAGRSERSRNPYAETYEERRERRQLERAFPGAVHDYEKQYSYVAIPNYANLLNGYRLEIGCAQQAAMRSAPRGAAAMQQHHVGVLGADLVERGPDAGVIVAVGAVGEGNAGAGGC
jgi:hypothetical protein